MGADGQAFLTKLPPPRQRHPGRDRQENAIHALVDRDHGVEGAQRDGVGIADAGIGDPAPPQGVVEHDQPARANEPERALVVVGVAGLIGVDEDEIEGA